MFSQEDLTSKLKGALNAVSTLQLHCCTPRLEEKEPGATHTARVTTHCDTSELKSARGFVGARRAAPSTRKGTPHTTADLHAMLPVPKDSYLAMAQNTMASGTKLSSKTNKQ